MVAVFSKTVTVSPSSTVVEAIAVEDSPRLLRLKKVTVVFPVGTENNLSVVILYGNMQVVPDSGSIVGDGVAVPVSANFEFSTSEGLKIKATNADTANSHACVVVLECEEVT